MKQPFSFRLEKDTSDYLRSVVKNSGFTMTEYIEILIEADRNSKPYWSIALVILEGRALFVSSDEYMQMICDSVSGEQILGCVPDPVYSSKQILPLLDALKTIGICKEIEPLQYEIKTTQFINAIKHHTGVDPKTNILEF